MGLASTCRLNRSASIPFGQTMMASGFAPLATAYAATCVETATMQDAWLAFARGAEPAGE